MPEMGVMVGRAMTLVIEANNPDHKKANPNAWAEYRAYIASQPGPNFFLFFCIPVMKRRVPGPKIVVVQDLDKPKVGGAFWGEVNANVHRAMGCVGTITDGSIRDLDEMRNAGFKAIARNLGVGHAHVCFICLFICLFVCLFVCSFVFLFVCLFVACCCCLKDSYSFWATGLACALGL